MQWLLIGGDAGTLSACPVLQGVSSPLAGQMVFRMTLFSAFGSSKRWLGTNADGSTRPLATSDFYKVLQGCSWCQQAVNAAVGVPRC